MAHFNSKKKEKISLDYWNGLSDVLKKNGIKSSWYYFFYPTNFIKKIKFAKQYISFQNKKLNKNENILIEEFISIRILFKSIFQYINILLRNLKYISYLKKFLKKKIL